MKKGFYISNFHEGEDYVGFTINHVDVEMTKSEGKTIDLLIKAIKAVVNASGMHGQTIK